MATDGNGNYLPPNGGRYSATAVLIAVVCVVALGLAAVVGLAVTSGPDSNSTPLIVTIIGFLGTTVGSLFALLRADQTRRELHNGLIPAKVHEAVANGIEQGTLHVRVDRSGMRERATDRQEGKSNG